MLGDAIPADLSLLVGAMVVGSVLGIVGGTSARGDRGRSSRAALQVLAAIFLCAPVYFVGFLVILLFAPSVGAPIPIPLVTVNTYQGLSEDPVAWLRALLVPWFVAGLPLAAHVPADGARDAARGGGRGLRAHGDGEGPHAAADHVPAHAAGRAPADARR